MSVVALAEGSIFAGRYKIMRSIAAGGMGAVYEVLHMETARRRALKVMLPHLEQTDDFRKRFQAEARIAGQVESAYIVDVFDAGVDEATKMPFLVMELLKGEELGKRLRRVGKFGFEETIGYLWQTALALDKTHKAHIVHRDLKPDNLFLCEDDEGPSRIKVLDFGIAKLMEEGGTQANATRAMGTPLYMAPEQFKSNSKVSPATDIYALGMMAYKMLVGASYWADEQATESNPYAFAVLVMQGPLEPPTARAIRQGIRLPDAFDEWFGQATSSKPEQRFFKATVAVKGLAQALGVNVPGTVSGDRQGMTTGPPDAIVGQIKPGQTKSVANASDPPPTAVLYLASQPAHQGTHASGYGLSASGPKVNSAPLVASQGMPSSDHVVTLSKRSRIVPLVMAGGLVLLAMVIGGVGLAAKSTGSAANTMVAVSALVPTEASAAPELPAVVPMETTSTKESAAAPAPSAPMDDRSARVDGGVAQDKRRPLKAPAPKPISTTTKKKTIHSRDD